MTRRNPASNHPLLKFNQVLWMSAAGYGAWSAGGAIPLDALRILGKGAVTPAAATAADFLAESSALDRVWLRQFFSAGGALVFWRGAVLKGPARELTAVAAALRLRPESLVTNARELAALLRPQKRPKKKPTDRTRSVGSGLSSEWPIQTRNPGAARAA